MEQEVELKKERGKSEELKIHGGLKQRAESPQGRMGSVIKAQKKKKAHRGQKNNSSDFCFLEMTNKMRTDMQPCQSINYSNY